MKKTKKGKLILWALQDSRGQVVVVCPSRKGARESMMLGDRILRLEATVSK